MTLVKLSLLNAVVHSVPTKKSAISRVKKGKKKWTVLFVLLVHVYSPTVFFFGKLHYMGFNWTQKLTLHLQLFSLTLSFSRTSWFSSRNLIIHVIALAVVSWPAHFLQNVTALLVALRKIMLMAKFSRIFIRNL